MSLPGPVTCAQQINLMGGLVTRQASLPIMEARSVLGLMHASAVGYSATYEYNSKQN